MTMITIDQLVEREVKIYAGGFISELATCIEHSDQYDDYLAIANEIEHWIVSEWLADELAKRDEKVAKDFFGFHVWARQTNGQEVANDRVIQDIYKDLIERL